MKQLKYEEITVKTLNMQTQKKGHNTRITGNVMNSC